MIIGGHVSSVITIKDFKVALAVFRNVKFSAGQHEEFKFLTFFDILANVRKLQK